MSDETFIRASSWATLFDCGYRWEGEQLLGMRKPLSHAMLVGTGLHRSTAAYDKAKSAGAPISISDAADVFVDTLWHPDEDVQRRPNEGTLQHMETIGLLLNKQYCHQFQYRNYKSVELTAEPLEVEASNGHVIVLTGTLDRSRIRTASMGIGITDLKTGKRAVRTDGRAATKNHGIQLGVYELLAEQTLGEQITEPAEIIGLRTGAKPAIGTATIEGPRLGLIGTEDKPGLIDMAGTMLASGIFYPNANSPFCGEAYCPRWEVCPYHG